MPIINLTTDIKSDLAVCFDLPRSIDLHKISTSQTKEEAIDGCIRGIIGLNEFVTWQATHFGIKQKLSSKITFLESPFYFRDEQIKGIFKLMVHDHYFQEKDGIVIMSDTFEFKSPFGVLGILFEKLILTNYLKRLLIRRNQMIKEYAESDKWKSILNYK